MITWTIFKDFLKWKAFFFSEGTLLIKETEANTSKIMKYQSDKNYVELTLQEYIKYPDIKWIQRSPFNVIFIDKNKGGIIFYFDIRHPKYTYTFGIKSNILKVMKIDG